MSVFDEADRREEERKRERAKRNALARAELAELTADLGRILDNPDPHLDTLARQADILDCMLYTQMRWNLRRDRESGYIDYDRLTRALTIQKQCMDTVKAAAAVDYMNTLVPGQRIIRHIHTPAPLTHDERTGETENP